MSFGGVKNYEGRPKAGYRIQGGTQLRLRMPSQSGMAGHIARATEPIRGKQDPGDEAALALNIQTCGA